MAAVDTYQELTNPHMIETFENLFELKRQKKLLETQIKELEAEYKPSIEKANRQEVFYVLPDGQKFNFKRSVRKGGWNNKKLTGMMDDLGMDEDSFRNKESVVFTLRVEGE